MTNDEFAALLDVAVRSLDAVVGGDWSRRAGTLDWTCWQTVDHMIDCVFSYAVQLAAGAESGFLPLQELHAEPGIAPEDLVSALRAIGNMFLAVAICESGESVASDGVVLLDGSDWCARAVYEISLHTHDVLSGLGATLNMPTALCAAVLSSPALWMLDRDKASLASDAWSALLLGSGRPAPG